MTDEPDNTPLEEDVTDNVETSEDDNADDFDFYDPEEDTVEDEQPEADDDEEEGETEGEADEAEPEETPAVYAEETARVKLADGTEVPVSELIQGRMMQQDYSRKTQEVANERKTVAQNAQQTEGITNTLVEYLASVMPEEPSVALAATDPNRYTREKATYDASLVQLENLIEIGRNAKTVTTQMSDQDRQQDQQAQNAALVQMFPDMADAGKREVFLNGATEAAKAVGYTDDQVKDVYDSKTIALAHWAKIGMDSVKAKETAKAKTANVPPVAPRKPAGSNAGKGNAEAMRKLSRSGSLDDALAVDFD